MSYSVRYDSEEDIIFVSVEGELNLSLIKDMAAEVSQQIKQFDCRRILNDLRQAKPAKTCLDIYNMPKQALQAGVTQDVRRALIIKEGSPGFKFLETVFVNQGNIVQLFTNVSEAKAWLLEKNHV